MRSFPALLALAAVAGLSLAPFATAAPRPETRPYVGILVGPADEDARGAIVRDVVPDGPAAKAGLKKGDLIVKCGKHDIADPKALVDCLASHKPGDKVPVTVMRDGKEETCNVTVAERPVARAAGLEKGAFLGVWSQDLTAEMKDKLGVAADMGAVVMEVMEDSPAAKAGLKVDDVITAVNDDAVANPQDLQAAVRKVGTGHACTLKVLRGKESLELKARLDELPLRFSGLRDFDHWPEMDHGRHLTVPPAIEKELQRRFEELQKRIRELEQQNPSTR
jgi:S1-C subfamily serine protease